MKKTFLALALLTALAAQAQDASSTSNSGSNSGATSNAAATGNTNASQSASGSVSRADSGSVSGAQGNVINLDQSVPSTQTVNQNVSGSTSSNSTNTSTSRSTVDGTSRESYDGTLRTQQSGDTTQRIVSSGGTLNTVNENVHYSGTQTIKNVPGIAMSGPASGPCTGMSGGLGLAGPGWGLGLNGSSVMADCRLRENTRVLGMAMQSLDGQAYPQEKGELTVLFMDAVRGLAAYNRQIVSTEVSGK